MWSMFMLNDNRRHSESYSTYCCKMVNSIRKASAMLMPRTTGSQEKRFSILRNLVLQGRKAARVDDFVALMKDHFVTVEKDYVATHFRTLKGQFFKASTTATRPLKKHGLRRKERS